jgi:hypothetical protein
VEYCDTEWHGRRVEAFGYDQESIHELPSAYQCAPRYGKLS